MPSIKRRACVTCTNAKSKCSPQSDNLCQRCARLGKQCVYLDLPERKRKRRGDDGRVVALESRVEELVAQLEALRNRGSVEHVTSSSDTNDGTTPSTETLSIPDALRGIGTPTEEQLLEAETEGYHGREPPTTSVLEGLPDIVDRGFLNVEEAESLVSQFKSRFVWKFPFVVLDPSQSVGHLRKEEPLLFLAVVSATIPSAHAIRKLVADEIMQHITSRIVASSERNLGLLRALLVLCAWYRYPAQKGNVQLVLLLDLCVTMLHDLGLHRSRGELTTDQQRALLGTYWVSASLPRVIKRPNTMTKSKKIDECCNNMAESTEYPSDRCIRPFILTQTFVSSVYDSYTELSESSSTDDSGHEESLVKVIVGVNLRQFGNLKTVLEGELSKCPNPTTNVFHCNMHYINIAIRDMALDDEHLSSQIRQTPSAKTFKTSAYRSSLLWHLLRHSKAFINAYIDIPDAELPQVTVFTLAQLCASLVILPRSVSALLKLIIAKQSPGVRRTRIQGDALNEARTIIDEADYLNVVVRLYNRLRILIAGLSGHDKGLDVAGTLCCHMAVLASWYGPRVEAILGVDLVVKSPLASITPPAAAVTDAVAAASAASLIPQQTGQNIDAIGSTAGQQGVLGAYTGAEDGSYLFSDELWASVLESFTNFG
ncbi:hypothetical protein ACHAQJ_000088 [Trichoderma viride]